MPDDLTPAEINKDSVHSALDAATETVEKVTGIVAGAVRDVAQALSDFGTEIFEIRDAARKAKDD